MRIFRFLPFLAVISLVACGGGSSSSNDEEFSGFPDDEPTTPRYQINSFEIVGTDEAENADPAIIDPAQNGGNFVLSYTIEDNTVGNYVGLFVSDNDTLSNADINFFDEFCSNGLTCGDETSFTDDCFFNNSNQLYCSFPDEDEEDRADISEFLDELPKDGFIILRACKDAAAIDCDLSTIAVQFQ